MRMKDIAELTEFYGSRKDRLEDLLNLIEDIKDAKQNVAEAKAHLSDARAKVEWHESNLESAEKLVTELENDLGETMFTVENMFNGG